MLIRTPSSSEDLELPLDGEISVTRKVGRKPKINAIPALAYTRMINRIRIGVSDETAATLIGINPGTFYRWMARGREALEIELRLEDDENPLDETDKKRLADKLTLLDPEERYRQFCEDIRRSRAECLASCEVRIREASPLTFLRRHDPRWRETGSDIQVNHSGAMNISGQIEHQVSGEIDAGLTYTPDVPILLSALQAWAELGFIELTETGKALFR
jgi:hypothetical protein